MVEMLRCIDMFQCGFARIKQDGGIQMYKYKHLYSDRKDAWDYVKNQIRELEKVNTDMRFKPTVIKVLK